jgi:hypothetical protein
VRVEISLVTARPPLLPVFFIAAAALAYEVLLMRLFSIVQWHHFAYMVISLALLGYGVSGTFLTLVGRWMTQRFEAAFVVNAVMFGLSAPGCFLLAQAIPFNAFEILWDNRQWAWLFIAYLLLFIPFFFAANCICLAFLRFPERISTIYSFDLLGAGVGSLIILVLLYLVSPITGLLAIATIALLAGSWALLRSPRRRPILALAPALLGVLMWATPEPWLDLRLSEYKTLSQTLRIPGTRVIEEKSSPLGLISVIESAQVPLRHAPGLSLSSQADIPPQLGMLIDGDGLNAINRYDGDPRTLSYLDDLTSALPYHVAPPGHVLVLGLGGGEGVLQALAHGAGQVDAVELNAQAADLVTREFATYSGWQHVRKGVRLHIAEARSYVQRSTQQYDLITLSLLDAAGAASGGVYGLNESYLYTVEAMRAYLERLKPNGFLAITRWVHLPPRDASKLFATAVDALRQADSRKDPGQRLMMIRGWKTSTLLVKQGDVTELEIAELKRFCRTRSFDLVYYPDMPPSEANHYNVLDEPYFYDMAQALLSDSADNFLDRYKFQVRPATDDQPYFYNFFKWSTLPEILKLKGRGGLSLLELGYPVLVATLAQAVLASLVLVLLPLAVSRKRLTAPGKGYVLRVAGYFTALGLAYIFIEIAFIQKLVLFLGHPLYAVAVALAGFLVFSGFGSRYAGKRVDTILWKSVVVCVLLLGGILALYLWLLPALFAQLVGLPIISRVIIALTLVGPVAFLMGMPFPLGLSALAQKAPALTPWAWGINGCASLISAIVATMLAIHFGFSFVMVTAIALYLASATMRLQSVASPR